jgi:APA family basic amino acid/polyamine antiporter
LLAGDRVRAHSSRTAVKMAEDPKEETVEGGTLQKELGVFELTMMGVGGIIGAGLFVLAGQAAGQYAGPAVILSFIIAGACSLVYALCFAEFAAMLPTSGSAYSYAKISFGNLTGFMTGWALIAEYAFAISAVSVGWSGYVTGLLDVMGWGLPKAVTSGPLDFNENHELVFTGSVINLPAVLLIAVAVVVICLGVVASARFTSIAVAIKVTVVVIFIVVGIWFIEWENYSPFIPESPEFGKYGWTGIMRAASTLLFAYIGFDAVTTAAGETKEPARDLPLAIMLSLGISTLLYVLVAFVMLGLVSYTELNVPDPIAFAVRSGGPGLSWLVPGITLAVVVGLPGVVFVALFSITRILLIMATDGMLPPIFKELNSTFHSPVTGALVCGVASALLAGLFPIGVLAELVSIGTLLAFAIVCAGVVKMRNDAPELKRPFEVPFSPYVPILGVVIAVAQIAFLSWAAWLRMLVWMSAGAVVWYMYGSTHAEPVQSYQRVE